MSDTTDQMRNRLLLVAYCVDQGWSLQANLFLSSCCRHCCGRNRYSISRSTHSRSFSTHNLWCRAAGASLQCVQAWGTILLIPRSAQISSTYEIVDLVQGYMICWWRSHWQICKSQSGFHWNRLAQERLFLSINQDPQSTKALWVKYRSN